MLTRIKHRVALRLARFLGVPGLNSRLDHLEQSHSDLLITVEGTRSQLDDFMTLAESNLFFLELKLKDYVEVQLTEPSFVADLRHSIKELRARQDAEHDFLELRSDDIAGAASDFTRLVQKETLDQVEKKLSSIRRQLDYLVSSQTATENPPLASVTTHTEGGHLPDLIYENFEDLYRGSEDEIKARQSFYLKFIDTPLGNGGLVVDIGCGRGEWLELLRDQNIDAIGVDINSAAVALCQAKNLNVVQRTGTEYLATETPASLRVITAFQVLEHLTLNQLLEFLRTCVSALPERGVLVVEFPNIEMPGVGYASFWRDPSHTRPLHPDLVIFLAQQVGFSHAAVVYPPGATAVAADQDLKLSSPDVGIIATK